MFAVSIFFILNSSYWDTPINLSLMLSCTCKVGMRQVFMEWHFKFQISLWQSLDLVFCTLPTSTCAAHGDAASFGSCSNLVYHLGIQEPRLSECIWHVPNANVRFSIAAPRTWNPFCQWGEGFKGQGWIQDSHFYRSSSVSTSLWISCLVYISRFKTSPKWSVIIMARESHCLLSYLTHQNKDLKIP